MRLFHAVQRTNLQSSMQAICVKVKERAAHALQKLLQFKADFNFALPLVSLPHPVDLIEEVPARHGYGVGVGSQEKNSR